MKPTRGNIVLVNGVIFMKPTLKTKYWGQGLKLAIGKEIEESATAP